MTNISPTHVLRLPDGYGHTVCEIVEEGEILSTVRVRNGAYWERSRSDVRVVRKENLIPLVGGADA